MRDPRSIAIQEFDYSLPEEKIATQPEEKRDSSRLLICEKNQLTEDVFSNISSHLPADSLIIFNDTKVIEARLLFRKPTGATIEVFCLEPGDGYPDITTALAQTGAVNWKCLVGNASSWNAGLILEKKIAFTDRDILLKASLTSKETNHFNIHLSWTPENISFAELLHHAGAIPLPPYIKRKAVVSDAERYQTVYAHFSGSVAAPTAGLHFTNEILQALPEENILKDFVTLHVGAGTFKPVKAETMNDHEMHSEFIEVNSALVQNLINHLERNIIAVGTTSLRTLESLYWLGKKLAVNTDINESDLHVNQWEPYEGNQTDVSPIEALTALNNYISRSISKTLITKTSLLIAPGYQFRIVNILVTNFHQPKSTLLLLVSAFIGDSWKKAYDYALKNNFRFLSYGDACLFFKR